MHVHIVSFKMATIESVHREKDDNAVYEDNISLLGNEVEVSVGDDELDGNKNITMMTAG